MTRLETIQGEIKMLSPEEVAELRRWLAERETPPQAPRKYTSEEIHRRLFPNGPPERRTIEELREGVDEYVRQTHARR
jgi:hypothetical protein